MPAFDWRFLIGAFLPGVPLSYTLIVSKALPFINIQDLYWWLILPLMLGLLIDGIRHGIEYIIEFVFKLILKNNKINWIWNHIKYEDIAKCKSNSDSYIRYLLENNMTIFHMYEFYLNTSLSLILSLIPAMIHPSESYPIWFLLIIPVLLICAFIRVIEYRKLRKGISGIK